jgi:hypothetical protein
LRCCAPQSRDEREPARVAALLQDARDAAQFLSEFVVQGAAHMHTQPSLPHAYAAH